MDTLNQKIIDAVIEKAEKLCPDSLDLIGIYGSVATGEEHEKSDLDLLILISDEAGRKLGSGFILEDRKVGYDIYCTDWNGLRYDAECHHANLSKLMDSQIVYIKNQNAYEELCRLREQTKQFLASEERFKRVDDLLTQAKVAYANACLSDELGRVRVEALGVMHYLMNAIMLFHGTYFKRGVKRTLEELALLPIDEVFIKTIQKIVGSKEVEELQSLLKRLLLYSEQHTRREVQKVKPSEELAGTYEEMYSNWWNKVIEAAENDDSFASYVNLCNFQFMLKGISENVEIGVYNVMDEYNPDSLTDNVRVFDKYLKKYEEVYQCAGLSVKRYSHIDEWIADYFGCME